MKKKPSSKQEIQNKLLVSTIFSNPWIPKDHRLPSLTGDGKGLSFKQMHFLKLLCKEALYGGAAGGGKSDALLMGALQYVDTPNYSAIIFRRTYADLTLPGALIDRSVEWLGGSEAKWNAQSHKWRFPSGATLAFGNLEREQDKFRYQSAEFQYVGFDELTQFTEPQYRYLFSRIRRLQGVEIPLRMRSASNPGNIGHDWVKQRFMVEGEKYGRIFIPATLDENKNLDRVEYVKSLNNLDPITRRQYLLGDWTARHGGSKFLREWFKDSFVNILPANIKRVRYWDMAATVPKANREPDYTVGALMGLEDGVFYIGDIKRFRKAPPATEAIIKTTAETDTSQNRNKKVHIYMEQEPGSSGIIATDHYARKVLVGYPFTPIRSTGSKSERANPVSTAAEAGNLKLVRASWNGVVLDELEAFPIGSHDDIVDAVSGAFSQLSKPRGRIVI